jgi:hypothetical protein
MVDFRACSNGGIRVRQRLDELDDHRRNPAGSWWTG